MSETHAEAIEANKKEMDLNFARIYDELDSQKFFNSVNARVLLEFDPLKVLPPTDSVIDKLVDLPKPGSDLWISKEPRSILDFAVGTGSLTEKLAPYLQNGSEVVGIDINESFMLLFTERIERLEVTHPDIKFEAVINDVLNDDTAQFQDRFDLIFLTISYHHIHNYETVTKKLALFLKKDGHLVIIDFYNEDVEKETAPGKAPGGAVQHMGGLKLEKLKETLGDLSGLSNVSAVPFAELKLFLPEKFIMNHSTQSTIDALKDGKLPQKIAKDGSNLFEITIKLVIATGTKLS
ncbi:uncharacterized protein KQ657_001148 [Scheffersomyces spartinae]|uniref:Methyltransferase domain-containing protein n=1 Tax=Scheffersomyces spartinae TaxID=45513 RepID=A0A9P8AHZ1_9ASCO|nr:uncharacterized protein KQ657_001148 [Scheffersomyces spartinae]KAG7193033.1 hypothetical protein KQ657_001148 [Scheffersomyces spartinae]